MMDTLPATGHDSPIRVLLADDHTLFRDGLKHLLAAPDIHVVADTGDGHQALRYVDELRPDVAIFDVQMPGPGPLALLLQARSASAQTKVVFLSMHEPPDLVKALEDHGAVAYLRKEVNRHVLGAAVRAAAAGMAMRSDTAASGGGCRTESLTRRDLEILGLVARALSNRQIAQELYLSESTVKRHLTSIYNKLDASSRVEALSRAMSAGLISGEG